MKQIYLLPNLLTTMNLFCGIYAIISALNGKIIAASWAILAAMFFDFLDGQVARLKDAASKFGIEYDSLTDLISFGLAPVIIVYLTFLKGMGRFALGIVFIYTACTALRLARFNSQKATAKKNNFTGLPSTAAGGFLAVFVIFIHNNAYGIWFYLVPFVVLAVSFLMISTIKYPSIGALKLWNRKPFLNLVAVIFGGSMLIFHLELFLFLCSAAYIFSGFLKPGSLKSAMLRSANPYRGEPENKTKTALEVE